MSQLPSPAILQAWASLVRAHDTVLRAVEAEMKAAGLPPVVWHDALVALRRAAGGELRPAELEGLLGLAQPNVSRLVDRLAAAGLAERRARAGDKRAQTVAITPAGRAILKRMSPVLGRALQREFGAKLGDAAAAGLAKTLDAIAPGPTEGRDRLSRPG